MSKPCVSFLVSLTMRAKTFSFFPVKASFCQNTDFSRAADEGWLPPPPSSVCAAGWLWWWAVPTWSWSWWGSVWTEPWCWTSGSVSSQCSWASGRETWPSFWTSCPEQTSGRVNTRPFTDLRFCCCIIPTCMFDVPWRSLRLLDVCHRRHGDKSDLFNAKVGD